jgi:hypothetical protein
MRLGRQPAQTLVLAALAMTAMIGALSMVVDAGVYFVLKQELQNTADAAVLNAVWYAPACIDGGTGTWWNAGCQPSNPDPTAQQCTSGPNVAWDPKPCTAAVNAAQVNWGIAASLCQGPNQSANTPQVFASATQAVRVPSADPLLGPLAQIGTYTVTLTCDAPHWFARVLPGVCQAAGPGCSTRISVSASAALGWLGPNGQLWGGDVPPPPTWPRTTTPLVARLIDIAT